MGACEAQTRLAPQVAPRLKRGPAWPALHRGYQQLSVIREKQGDLAEALRLAREAQAQGWQDSIDDWSKRIARLEKRLAKG